MKNILTVCGMGSGSSLILKINIDNILKELGIKANVNAVDLGSYKSSKADIIFTTKDLKSHFAGTNIQVVFLNSVLDKKTIKEELETFFNKDKRGK